MNIAIISPFNPFEVKDLLYNPESVYHVNVVATSVHAIVRGLLKLGHNVTVITSSVGEDSRTIEYSGENFKIYIVQNKYRRVFFGLNVYPKVRKILRDHIDEFDVLHAQWTYEYAYSIIPFVKQKTCFCSVRDWCPYLMTFPTNLKGRIQMRILYHYFKNVMKCNDIVKVANSLYTYKCISQYLNRYDIPQIFNPVKSEIIVTEIPTKSDNPVFISITQRLTEERKNIPTLIKAFSIIHKLYPTTILKLVGEGNQGDFAYLQQEGFSLDGIEFLGRMSHDKLMSEIERSSILVHPAFEETFGNILLEAGAKFKPCIGGYDSGAVPQVLDYGRAGCLCDVSNVHSLKEAMLAVMNDNDYYQQISSKMYSRIQSCYIDNKVCRELVVMYKTKMNKNADRAC